MNDDQMDELLTRGARDYNEPGPVPRDEMWARIAKARRAARGVDRVAAGGVRRWVWISGAVAAALVLAVGIVIGRRLERATPDTASAVAVGLAKTDSAKPATPDRLATTRQTDSIIPRLRQETAKTGRRVQELAAVSGSSSSNAQGAASETPSLAYRLVVLQHLAGSEAMITAFRASARRGEVDAQIAAWSRELLSTTRMLEASPVTQDPTMKRLLEDLDLVIVQIAQYATLGTTNPDELDLIEQSINRRGVISKLRSALPVRNTPAGT